MMGAGRFDVDDFVAECERTLSEGQPLTAMRDVLDRALTDSSSVAAALDTERAGLQTLHRSPHLTVLNVVWPPGMYLFPHDHRMWAAIGIYGGIEENEFFRRSDGGIVSSGGKTVEEREVLLLGDDAIHAVTNPRGAFTGALHVYGGDFFGEPRSEWDPQTFEEQPFDQEHVQRAFDDAAVRWRESQARESGA